MYVQKWGRSSAKGHHCRADSAAYGSIGPGQFGSGTSKSERGVKLWSDGGKLRGWMNIYSTDSGVDSENLTGQPYGEAFELVVTGQA